MERLVVQLMPVAELYIVEPARIAVLGQAHGRRIVHQRRLHFPAPQHVGQAGVIQIQRLPPGIGQSEAPGHDRPADGNGREPFAIGVLEQEPLSGKTIQIGRFDVRVAVAPQIVELERIQHHDDDILLFAHDNTFCFFRVESKGAGDHFAISPLMTSALRTDSSSTNARQSLLSR